MYLAEGSLGTSGTCIRPTREETIGEARNLTARWHSLPHEEKRQIVEAITERIVIAKDNIEIGLLQLHGASEYVAKGHTNDA